MLPDFVKPIKGGVTAPQGILASGTRCGIKTEGPDLALVCAEQQAAAAAVFTRNRFAAAPVQINRKRIASGEAQAVILNSGCANACTGAQGLADARKMAKLTADALRVPERLVLVASTGMIGTLLPMDKIEAGMVKAVRGLSRRGGAKAARAIMTTDLAPKEAAVEFTLGTSKVRIGGMAKGSGMIAPNMATMLSVITTDAQVPARDLAACLRHAADRSFNCITVDGDSSTNDTVFLLATGAAMRKPIAPEDLRRFRSALTGVSTDLAHQIVADGEGATHFVTVTVRGAASREDALAVAKTIANSQLVKTAVFGMDPNWGRVMAAAGRAGVAFDPRRVDLHLDGMPLVLASEPAPFDPAEAAEKMKKREVEFVLHLHAGRASATAWTCDLSHDYVTINAHYHT